MQMAKLEQIELINCDCLFKTQKNQMHLKPEILKLMIYVKYSIVLSIVNLSSNYVIIETTLEKI